MNIEAIDAFNNVAVSATRDIAAGVQPITDAYRRRRDHLVAQASRTEIHAELIKRYRAQLLMLDVTGQQWQTLVESTSERLAGMTETDRALLDAAAQALLQRRRDPAGTSQPDAFDRLVVSAAQLKLEMARASAWLTPWSRAAAASTLLAVQQAFQAVLETTDGRAAKAAVVAVGKKAVDFIPVLGPILTGAADAYDVADTAEAATRTTSDELTRLDDYVSALEHLALTFESILLVSEGDRADAPTAEKVLARIQARQAAVTRG